MTKFKKDLKKILLVVAGSMLLFNAGFDISRWIQNERVKRAAAASMVEDGGPIVKAEAKWCTLSADVGLYVCDIELTIADGRKGRVLQVFSPEDLAGD
jgi:hypothetical protein